MNMSSELPEFVKIVDVGPRDGLQNEKNHVPAADKIALVGLLQEAGLREIEVTSFVSPKWVPQMADALEVMAGIVRRPGGGYSVLTPHKKGWGGGAAAKPGESGVFGGGGGALRPKKINRSHPPA